MQTLRMLHGHDRQHEAHPTDSVEQGVGLVQSRGGEIVEMHPGDTIGDFSPKMVSLTDDVVFGDIWERPELTKRDRSLVTITALISGGHTEQLPGHLRRALDNGVTREEIVETITHLAFYAGWPRAMSAITVAKNVFGEDE